jgi:hypothetical protein
MLAADPPPQVELAWQVVPVVQTFESSQAVSVRQAQLPPALVQRHVCPPQPMVWHRVWVDALQV